jgi:predicted glycogen debranching enzyme
MDFLKTEVKKGVTILDSLLEIATGIASGAPNGVKMDKASGLVFSPAHFTWMDTNYPAGTPRQGYPIEIQALWFAALRFLAEATCRVRWAKLATQVKDSIESLFRLPDGNRVSDCLHCSPGASASKAVADDHVRPNQLLAITLGAIDDPELCKAILAECSSLLIPGAIRSLADEPVNFPLQIAGKDGKPLVDPNAPYCGRYEGDEDARRKPAYHNGTAWTWLFPSYSEAWFMTYGRPGLNTAKALLSSSKTIMDNGSVGQIPEILDGDWPHVQRGCDAQAWGVSELFRVWRLLHSK